MYTYPLQNFIPCGGPSIDAPKFEGFQPLVPETTRNQIRILAIVKLV